MSPPRATLEDELGRIAGELDGLASRVQQLEDSIVKLTLSAETRTQQLADLTVSVDKVREQAVTASKELRDELVRSLDAMRAAESAERAWWRGIVERVVEAGIKAGQALIAALCGVIGLAGAYYFTRGP